MGDGEGEDAGTQPPHFPLPEGFRVHWQPGVLLHFLRWCLPWTAAQASGATLQGCPFENTQYSLFLHAFAFRGAHSSTPSAPPATASAAAAPSSAASSAPRAPRRAAARS